MSRRFVKRLSRNSIPFCGKRKRKERRVHLNKYKHLVFKKINLYEAENKRFRNLPLPGKPGEVIPAGTIVIYHGRRYRLKSASRISEDGVGNGDFEICTRSYA